MSEYLNRDHCNGDFPLCAAHVKPIFTVKKQLNLRDYAQICPQITFTRGIPSGPVPKSSSRAHRRMSSAGHWFPKKHHVQQISI